MARVTMRHPQSGVTQDASAAAFERVWAPDGWLLVEEGAEVEPEAASGPDATGEPGQVPDGPIAAVMDWVGADPDRAAHVLEAERAKGEKARKTLVDALTALIPTE